MAVVVGAVVAGVVQPVVFAAPAHAAPAAPTGSGSAVKSAVTQSAALAAAEDGGLNVEITSLRSESGEVYATPDGQLEAVQHLKPVRTRVEGAWKAIDNTLVKGADGSVTPRAAAVGLEFSGGGSGPLATLERAGRKLSFTWPTALPIPVLDGDSALYKDVLPDVDLKVSAATEGFSELLVVNTADAARNPALAELKLKVDSPGLELKSTDAGGLEAVDEAAGGVVFQAPQPIMWDSGQTATAGTQTAKSLSAAEGDAATGGADGPGDASNVAPIQVAVSADGGQLSLTPDQDLLTGADTTFPVYIDPQTYTPKAGEWTMVSKYWASSPQWHFNGDSDAGVGFCGWDYCAPNDTKRLFFQFPTSRFAGKSIVSATFVGHETWSASCNETRSVQLWRTKAFGSSTTWNSSADNWLDLLDSRDVAHGGAGCAAGDVEFNATAGVKYAASHSSTYTSFGLRAASETDKYGWKRFSDDAYLRVKYNLPPKQLSMGQLAMSPGATCHAWDAAVRVRSLPKIMANDVKDPDGDRVAVQFQLYWAASGSTMTAQWTSGWLGPKASGSDFNSQLIEQITSTKKIPQNKSIAWFARVRDYDEGNGYSTSAWSGAGNAHGCYFVWDTNTPAGPSITSGAYPMVNDADPDDPEYDGVGRYGTFTVKASDSDVTKYWLGVNELPSAKHELTTTGGAAASITFRPTRAGTNFVYAQAFDGAGRGSEPSVYKFRVKEGQPSRAQWKLDDPADAAQAQGSAQQRSLALEGGPTLSADGVKDKAVSFDGVDDYLASDIPTVDTSLAFSVSAWAKLDKMPDKAAVIAAQPGNNSPGFELYYSQYRDRWAFNQYASDTAGAEPVRAEQAAAGTVTAARWTHLVGTYSPAAKKLSLYVDGALAGSIAYTSPWDARRGLQIGAGSYDGSPDNFFPGTIDDVRIFDKALTQGEITALYTKQDSIGSGRPARAVFPLDEPATDEAGKPTTKVTGHAQVNAAVFQGGAASGQIGRDGKALTLDGVDDYASTTPHLDTQRSYTVMAWANLSAAKPAHASTVVTQSGAAKPSFELYYSPSGGWSFNHYSSDDTAGTVITASQGSADKAPGGAWTQVAGTYDAFDGYLRLYVQGQFVTMVKDSSPFAADGLLQIGASRFGSVADHFFPGQIADVQTYDRALSAPEMADLFDQQASVEGRWKLDAASGSPASSTDDVVRKEHTNRPLTLGSGAHIDTSGSNNMVGTGGLLLDGTANGFAATGSSPIDTSASFTASAWVTAPSRPIKPVTVMSMAGATSNGFVVRYVPDSADPANAGRWQLQMANADTTTATTSTAEHTNFQNNNSWNHLAVVYDAYAGQMRLYVDGLPEQTLCADDDDNGTPNDEACTDKVSWDSSVLPFAATKGLQLGRGKTGSSTWGEYWSGVIDDVWVFQGAASDTQIAALANGEDIATSPGP
ncbi:LamG-like jellyroll fold domain-containing protein [Streptomyces sp. NPDC050095]|uniref:LamG-like jellyroll fold domain-containing protein n=1 Tax=unclassified Streptomyces TaxID=2593676 RepID=UPI003429D2D9